jgi:nascent polypeptide-associated complex subunit alpha
LGVHDVIMPGIGHFAHNHTTIRLSLLKPSQVVFVKTASQKKDGLQQILSAELLFSLQSQSLPGIERNRYGPSLSLFLMAEDDTPTDQTPATTPSEDAPADTSKPSEGQKAPHKNSRAEKKMRESLLKFGLKAVPGVSTVMMRKTSQQLIWNFTNPDVYQLDNVYVIFGEVAMQNAGDEAVRELKKTAVEDEAPTEAKPTIVEDEPVADQETPSDLKEEDITTLMGQANVTRGAAIEALREAGGDLVTAVMNLTL